MFVKENPDRKNLEKYQKVAGKLTAECPKDYQENCLQLLDTLHFRLK